MGPGTGQGAPSRTTPMDTLRALAGDITDFLTNRVDMVRANAPEMPSGTGRDRMDAIANRTPEEARAAYDAIWNNPFFGPMVMGIKAYHGSPHDFPAERLVRLADGRQTHITGAPDRLPDVPAGAEVIKDFPLGRFRMDKIGTGEGAQVYGHGLYTAGNEVVAREYRDALKWRGTDWNDPRYVAGYWLAKNSGDADKAAAYLDGTVKHQSTPEARNAVEQAIAALRRGEGGANSANPGRMYEVDINTTPDRLLDWDKPLGEQPAAVQDAINRVGRNVEPYGLDRVVAEMRPVEMRRLVQSPEGVNALARQGVDGIQYLDQGSRSAGDGTRNYVMFDDSLINILRKYGILAPLMGAGAMEAVGGGPEEQ